MLAPKTCVNPSRITVESNGNHVIHLLRLYLLRPGFIESLCMLPVLPQTLLRNFKASFIEEKTQCLMDVHNGPWFHFDSRSAIRVQVFDRQVDIGYGLAPSKPASTKKRICAIQMLTYDMRYIQKYMCAYMLYMGQELFAQCYDMYILYV